MNHRMEMTDEEVTVARAALRMFAQSREARHTRDDRLCIVADQLHDKLGDLQDGPSAEWPLQPPADPHEMAALTQEFYEQRADDLADHRNYGAGF